MKQWFQSNTIRIALAAILGAWAAYFGDTMDLQTAVMATVGALLAVFLRKGQNVPIGLLLVGVCLSGCVMTTTEKFQFIEKVEVLVQQPEGDPVPQAKDTLCDVSISMSATDGTDQTQETKTDAEVEAAVTGQGAADVSTP